MELISKPPIKYAKSGEVHIAHQIFGKGPVDLVVTPGAVSHLDVYWEEPGLVSFFNDLAQFSRVILFDKRGTGLSDRNVGVPTFEERMDDIRAVMDSAKSKRAVLLGQSEGVPMSILFASSFPNRTLGLILVGGEAKGMRSPDYPWQATKEQYEELFRRDPNYWGTPEHVERALRSLAPSRTNDAAYKEWLRRLFMLGSSPGASIALSKSEMMMDVRAILPAVHVPTLLLHAVDDQGNNVEESRYIASRIAGSRLVEMPGRDHIFSADPRLNAMVVEETRKFVLGLASHEQEFERVLTTVVFTDIVDSTKTAASVGDERWSKVLRSYTSSSTNLIRKYRGRLIKSTGDGTLAIFDGPSRAIKYADELSRSAREMNLGTRIGIHTGECLLAEDDVSGIAVHVAARVMGECKSDEVLVTSTVKDLVYGSGATFEERGLRELKGLPERWHIYALKSLN